MIPPILKHTLLAVAVAGIFAAPSKADIIISNFNNFSTQLFPPMGISWNGGSPNADQYTQNSGSISITTVNGGNPQGDGYLIAGLQAGGSLNFTGLGFFNLTARVDAGNASSIMHVELFDSFFTKVASTIFQASNFTSSFTTQSKAISYTGLGNVADVTYFRIDGDGIASDSFRYSYENLAAATTAVPEPSTYALGAGILLGLCIARRELRKRRAA